MQSRSPRSSAMSSFDGGRRFGVPPLSGSAAADSATLEPLLPPPPDRRRAEAALWRAAKAEGGTPCAASSIVKRVLGRVGSPSRIVLRRASIPDLSQASESKG